MSLNTQIAIAAFLGIGMGVLAQLGWIPSPETLGFIAKILGVVFTSGLKLVLMPLIFFTLASSILHLRQHRHGMRRVWQWTLGYFGVSVIIAAITGLCFVHLFKPGVGVHLNWLTATGPTIVQMDPQKVSLDFIKNALQNPVAALANQNVFAIVVFAIVVGVGLLKLGKKTEYAAQLLEEWAQLMHWCVQVMMRVAPLGVFGLLYQLAATQNMALFQQVGLFIVVVFGGTLWHGFINTPFILWILTRKNPYKVLWQAQQPLITAFSTASSSATLPVTMETVQTKLGVDPSIGAFVTSLGATVNMDGTALYEAMAALFVANLLGVHLSLIQQVVVVIVSCLASIGAPGIPSAGMVTMMMVLQAVGLPGEAVAILLPIDRLLDTVRTMVNVEGDIVGAVIVQSKCED